MNPQVHSLPFIPGAFRRNLSGLGSLSPGPFVAEQVNPVVSPAALPACALRPYSRSANNSGTPSVCSPLMRFRGVPGPLPAQGGSRPVTPGVRMGAAGGAARAGRAPAFQRRPGLGPDPMLLVQVGCVLRHENRKAPFKALLQINGGCKGAGFHRELRRRRSRTEIYQGGIQR